MLSYAFQIVSKGAVAGAALTLAACSGVPGTGRGSVADATYQGDATGRIVQKGEFHRLFYFTDGSEAFHEVFTRNTIYSQNGRPQKVGLCLHENLPYSARTYSNGVYRGSVAIPQENYSYPESDVIQTTRGPMRRSQFSYGPCGTFVNFFPPYPVY